MNGAVWWYAYTLAAFGLAYIIGHSTISLPLRVWLGGTREPLVPGKFGPLGDFLCALLECPACFGFWTGVVSGLTVAAHEGDSLPRRIGWALFLGCFTAGSNFLIGRATRLI